MPRRRPTGELFSNKALFERSRDPIFVLNRRRRLRYANSAWEQLVGQPVGELYNLHCIRDRRASPLAQALAPPPEVLAGKVGLSRRPAPPARVGPPWWDISFLPLWGTEGLLALVGRIVVVGSTVRAKAVALPEGLVQLRQRLKLRYSLTLFESETPSVRRAEAQARVAATNLAPVLIVGESGTGKRLLARAIHYQGITADRPFVEVNCRGLPTSAAEWLLFGTAGLANAERLGTVYLSDPAALSRELQAQLVERLHHLGSGLRVIASLHEDPASEVKAGRMLSELWHWLDVQRMELPPLRERPDDLPRLVAALLDQLGRAHVTVSPDAMRHMADYSWPGNLRELRSLLERVAEHVEVIQAVDLPEAMRRESRPVAAVPRKIYPLEELTEQFRRRLVLLALRQARGHKAEAARLLDVSRTELWRRMNQLGIGEDDWRSVVPREGGDAPSTDRPH